VSVVLSRYAILIQSFLHNLQLQKAERNEHYKWTAIWMKFVILLHFYKCYFIILWMLTLCSISDEWMSMQQLEWYWHWGTEVLIEKLDPVPQCSPQMPHGFGILPFFSSKHSWLASFCQVSSFISCHIVNCKMPCEVIASIRLPSSP